MAQEHSARVANEGNTQDEVRHWRKILRLRDIAADLRRYKVFPARADDHSDIGLVMEVGGLWQASGLKGSPCQAAASRPSTLPWRPWSSIA